MSDELDAYSATVVRVAETVLPSVAMTGGSELRTLVLVSAGGIAVLAAGFLPDRARGLPLRILVLLAGWATATLAALVRGCAVALGESSVVIVEFWPLLALVVGVVAAVSALRRGARPDLLPETLLAASIGTAGAETDDVLALSLELCDAAGQSDSGRGLHALDAF